MNPQDSETLSIDVKIAAICSAPRIAWNDSVYNFYNSLRPFNIPLTFFGGAYWEMGMQNGFESCIEKGVDWILTLDYDSMITPQMVDLMLYHFGTNPQIDALAALQPKRSKDSIPLVGLKEPKTIEIEMGKPFQCYTSHFGLTLIRTAALKECPKPWFLGVPSPTGSWQDGCIHPDIYFWSEVWAKNNKTVYTAPDVRIGHLQLMVSQCNEDFTTSDHHVSDWRTEHPSS